MAEDDNIIEQNTERGKGGVLPTFSIESFKPKHLLVPFFFAVMMIAAVALGILPFKMQLALILVVPAVIICAFILMNPYIGIYLYFLYEFLRPPDIIPALRPLRLGMVIEIITLLSWIISLTKTHARIKWNTFNWAYLGYLGVIAITVVTAVNNRLAYNMFQLMLVDFIIFVLATNEVNTAKGLNKIIWLLILIHTYFALKGLYNFVIIGYVIEGQRTSGVVGSSFMSDENDFALALNVMIPFVFFIFNYAKEQWKRIISLTIVLIMVLGVISSQSRGGWVGLVVVLMFCVLKSKRKLLSLGVMVVLALVVMAFAPSGYWGEMQSIENVNEGTALTRINYWKAGLRMFIDNPLIGVGAGNGPIRMPEYVTGFRNAATQWGRTFHGTIPQLMAELGGLGAICYMFMLIFALRTLFKLQKQPVAEDDDNLSIVTNSIICSIAGYFATATFLSTVYYPQLWMLYVLTFSLFYCYPAGKRAALAEDN